MKQSHDPRITFQSEDLAVPEVKTGQVPEPEKLEEDREEIRFDGLALPEIRISRTKPEK